MHICENCGIEKEEKYSSGRFCSVKCARSFSTKAKRKEINQKVSEKLKFLEEANIHCKWCNIEFATLNKKRVFCSRSCKSSYTGSVRTWSISSKQKLTESLLKQYRDGSRTSFPGNYKRYEYIKDDSFINVSGSYELITCKALDFLKEKGLIHSWKYSSVRIPYLIVDKIHTYIVDFSVQIKDKIILIETKGRKSSKDDIKWEEARKTYNLLIWENKHIKELRNDLAYAEILLKDFL